MNLPTYQRVDSEYLNNQPIPIHDQLARLPSSTDHGDQALPKQGSSLSSATDEAFVGVPKRPSRPLHRFDCETKCRYAQGCSKYEAGASRPPQGVESAHSQPRRQVFHQGRRPPSLRILAYGLLAQVHPAVLRLEGRAGYLHLALRSHTRLFFPQV